MFTILFACAWWAAWAYCAIVAETARGFALCLLLAFAPMIGVVFA